MKRFNSILFFCFFLLHAPAQSLEKNVENRLKDFFANYQTSYADIGTCALERFSIDHQKKTLHVYANDNFGYQPFTEAKRKSRLPFPHAIASRTGKLLRHHPLRRRATH